MAQFLIHLLLTVIYTTAWHVKGRKHNIIYQNKNQGTIFQVYTKWGRWVSEFQGLEPHSGQSVRVWSISAFFFRYSGTLCIVFQHSTDKTHNQDNRIFYAGS